MTGATKTILSSDLQLLCIMGKSPLCALCLW
jgi:hypothetical protein